MKRSKLVSGALWLTLTGFLLRALGMLLRVYISSKIGEEGMGLYQLIQSVYFLFITIAQSGISVALTRIMSARLALGDKSGAEGVFKSSLKISAALGSISCAILCIGSPFLCRFWLGDVRCIKPIIVLSFSLPFVAVCAVLTSYFIVRENASLGCIAQIIEQFSRIGIIAFVTTNFYLPTTAQKLTGVVVGNTVSESLSCLFLFICYKIYKNHRASGRYTKKLISTATPIALSRYLASFLRTVENTLVPNAITAFTLQRTEALSQFGALKGMALPLLFFPYSVLAAITTLLAPRVSGAQAVGNKQSLAVTTERVCQTTLTLSFAAAGIFFVTADSLGILIYKSARVSELILLLCPIVPFMYLDSVCDGLLKGLGKQKEVLIHNCIDSVVRIILICIVVPFFGIYGFVGIMVVSNILISLLNFYTLTKTANIKFCIINRIFPSFLITAVSAFSTKILVSYGAPITKSVVQFIVFCLFFALFYGIFIFIKKFYKNKDKKCFILNN